MPIDSIRSSAPFGPLDEAGSQEELGDLEFGFEEELSEPGKTTTAGEI